MEKLENEKVLMKNKRHNFNSIEQNVVTMEAKVIRNRRSRSLNFLRDGKGLSLENKDYGKHIPFKTSAEIIKDAEKSLLACNPQGKSIKRSQIKYVSNIFLPN